MSLSNTPQTTHFPFNLNQSETSHQLNLDFCAAKARSSRPVTPNSPLTPSPSLCGDCPIYNKNVQDENAFLLSHGYRKLHKLHETTQGGLYSGIQINLKNKTRRRVAIKKTHKLYHLQSISKQNDMIHYVEKNIIKESQILHHLTVSNRCTADYIVQYIDFIESSDAYYLIMEHIDTNINLKQFIIQSHKYIKNGLLKRKEYNKIIKYIFFQIFSVVQWMHNDMQCCHLNLSLENIMLEHAEFIIKSTSSVHINPLISTKLCDFGTAEIFKNGNFSCYKPFSVEYLSPMLYGDNRYDARSLDIYSLGVMLYYCCMGKPLFSNNKNEYILLKNNKLKNYLLKKKIINSKFVDLLCNLLLIDELRRFKIMDVLTHKCYSVYYEKYKHRILQKAKEQKLKLIQQKETLNNLPYYNSNVKRVFV